MRILSAADVQASVNMAAAIQLMRDAFAQLSAGTADVPDRVALRVSDRNAAALVMPAYLRATGQLGLKVVGVFPENAVRGMPTTSATAPLFRGAWVRSGTHVNAIGAFTPTARELDGALMRRALIVVDARTTEVATVGDLALAAREGAIDANAPHTELGEVVLGTRPGRTDPEQITCFKSVGNAAQDVVVADHAYREALRLGLGLEVELS